MEAWEIEMWSDRVLDVLRRTGAPMSRQQIANELGGFDEGGLEFVLLKMASRGLIEADEQVFANQIHWRIKR